MKFQHKNIDNTEFLIQMFKQDEDIATLKWR